MGRNRFENEFNVHSDPHCCGPRGHRGPAGLFGLVFSLVSLGITIAFNVLGLVLHVFTGASGGNKKINNEPPNQAYSQQAASEKNKEASERAAKAAAEAAANKQKQNTVKKEQVKETFNQDKPEHTSDWNILLFVLTLIPIIITLAMKRLDLAGLVFLGGTTLIILYNIIRNTMTSLKSRKKQKQNIASEEKKEDNEVERIIKDAFEKVYAIRKDLFRISNPSVKSRLEGLCNMAEKIIGEVREILIH